MQNQPKPEAFTLTYVFLKLAQSIKLVRAGFSISKSTLSVLVYFKLGPFQKIWFSASESFEGRSSRAETIGGFIQACQRRFRLFNHLNWSLGIEGSGILVRILEGEVTEGTPVENSILWEIKRTLPFALSASEYSYRILEIKNKKYRALVTVLKKEFLADLLSLMSDSSVYLDSIHVTSLSLADGPGKRDFALLYQGRDYSFVAFIKKRQLVFFHIAHDANPARSWENAQKSWLKYTEEQEVKNVPVFRFQSDENLQWLPGQRALVFQPQSLPALSNDITASMRNELINLSANAGFSPDLLPVETQKRNLRANILWASIALFLVIQVFTPAIYTSLKSRRTEFLSNSRFSSLPRDIQSLDRILKKIEDDKKEILFLTNLLNKTSFTYAYRFRALAAMVSPDIVLKRVRGNRKFFIIDGYGRNLPVITDFLQDLEPEFPSGKFKMETEKKGELIGFILRWKKNSSRES